MSINANLYRANVSPIRFVKSNVWDPERIRTGPVDTGPEPRQKKFHDRRAL
jgi:hypothetical protein